MKKENQTSSDAFNEELNHIKDYTILSPSYRKKKTIIWLIRTIIAIILFIIFWQYQWVRWALIVYIPLNLINLLSIYSINLFMRKKIKRTQQKLDMIDDWSEEDQDEISEEI